MHTGRRPEEDGMDEWIDRLARAMARGTSRKDFLKLAGASLLSLLAAEAQSVALASEDSKREKDQEKQQTCEYSCAGCCVDHQTCAPGDSHSHCGTKGEPCKTCAEREACSKGKCVPGNE